MIIALTGAIGSGKDTVANYLENFHEFNRESFASNLKDAVSAIFGWDRTLLEGRSIESREWREQPDVWWSNRLNIPHLTPRWVLQYFATDICREHFHNEIWIASLENKLRNSKDNIVISDCRFVNEFNAIKSAGGTVIRVRREHDPEWIGDAKAASGGDHAAKARLTELNIHESEWSMYAFNCDYVIDNTGTIDDLYNIVLKNVITPMM